MYQHVRRGVGGSLWVMVQDLRVVLVVADANYCIMGGTTHDNYCLLKCC